MSSKLQFELASPLKRFFDKPVAMVTVPGGEGAYSVLVGHAPMTTEVGPGIVEIYENDDQTISERFFVTGGFCEVTGERCTLTANEILSMKSLVKADIESEIKALIAESDALGAEDSRESVESRLAIAQAKLAAVSL